jgi:glycosyltransferase involved in cell wall biosynthesis
VSNFSKSEILKYVGIEEEKIKVIYNGVDHNLFKIYSRSELEEFKNKLNLPERFLLYVGNVKPHKNLRRLILALEGLIKRDEDLYLVIVGKKKAFSREISF